MTGMAMMQILFRMSLQGSIIIGIILLLRMVFRGLRISYRYCVLLWGIAFFYLIFPWKIENAHGFWRAQPEKSSGGVCGRTDGGNGTGNEHRAGAEYLTGTGHYDRAEYSAGE